MVPDITDLQSGLKVLASLPSDPSRSGWILENFLFALLTHPPAQPVCFALLEKARIPIATAVEATARQYTNRFLPLDDFEEEAFQRSIRLWKKMAEAYAWCLNNLKEEGTREERESVIATLISRSMHALGQIMNEHYRGRRELPVGIWIELHRRYLLVEDAGVTQTLVHDPLFPSGHQTSCAAIYIAALLVSLGGPHRLSIRDQELMQRWAAWWAPLACLEAIGPNEELPDLAIDMRSDSGIKLCANGDTPRESIRRIEVSRLFKKLRNSYAQLRQNLPPLQIGLGDRCTPNRARRLLKALAPAWSLQTLPRRFPRYPSKGAAHVVSGFEDIRRFLKSPSPAHGTKMSYETQSSDIMSSASTSLFWVDMVERSASAYSGFDPQPSVTPFPDDGDASWKISNQSANGLCISRPASGKKLAHHQLLAIRTEGRNAYFLAHARWVVQAQQGYLIAGISAFPGVPRAISILFNIDRIGGRSEPVRSYAFLLPASEALGIPAMLVMQHADYQPERKVDICTINSEQLEQRVILGRVQQEGSDFQYVSFDSP